MGLAQDFVREMEYEGLAPRDQAQKIAEKIATIKGDVQIAEAESKAGVKALDFVWRAKAKAAQRAYGLEHQRILREAGDAERERKLARQDVVEQRFLNAASKRLPSETFKAIMAEAQA